MNRKKVIAIPYSVFNSHEYNKATPYAKNLLLEIASQYDGYNNGCLISTWSYLKETWNSPVTAYKARVNLLELGLIIEVSKGGAHKPQMFALPEEWEIAYKKLK